MPSTNGTRPDATPKARVEAVEASVILTDDEVAVADERRVAMSVPIERLRRVEFGIEKGRPVTLILVPDSPSQSPQVLTIPQDQYEAMSTFLVALAGKIAEPLKASE